MMNELFELLEKYTEDKGSWELTFNEHKNYYESIKEYLEHIDENPDIDFKQDMYRLTWNQLTPVGHYDIIANNLYDIYLKVKEICKEL